MAKIQLSESSIDRMVKDAIKGMMVKENTYKNPIDKIRAKYYIKARRMGLNDKEMKEYVAEKMNDFMAREAALNDFSKNLRQEHPLGYQEAGEDFYSGSRDMAGAWGFEDSPYVDDEDESVELNEERLRMIVREAVKGSMKMLKEAISTDMLSWLSGGSDNSGSFLTEVMPDQQTIIVKKRWTKEVVAELRGEDYQQAIQEIMQMMDERGIDDNSNSFDADKVLSDWAFERYGEKWEGEPIDLTKIMNR